MTGNGILILLLIQAGEGGSLGEYRLFTIDASDPSKLEVTAGFETDARYNQRKVCLMEDLQVLPRDPAFGDPQFWKSRVLSLSQR